MRHKRTSLELEGWQELETMPAGRRIKTCWTCGSDRHVDIECPTRHDVVDRRRDDIWDADAIQKIESIQP